MSAVSLVDSDRLLLYIRAIVDIRTPPVRAALRNHDLVRALAACATSTVSEWALWIGALVYANERSGATAAGLVSIGLVVPAALAAPLAGSIADGARPARTLTFVYALHGAFLAVAAFAAHRQAPLLIVVIPVAATTTLMTFVRPAMSVVVPGTVTTAHELTSANLLSGYADNAAILVGPLLAGFLLEVDGPALVLAACALLACTAAVVSFPVEDAEAGSRGSRCPRKSPRRGRLLVAGARRLAERRGAAALLLVLGGQYVLIGGLDLVYVILAADELNLDSSGPGLLSAMFGAGAVVGGLCSTLFVARRRLVPLLVLSLVVMVCALFVLAAYTRLPVALVALPAMGIARAVLDVVGRMLMQRAAPHDALASVFATLEALSLVGMVVGSVLVQVLIASAGVRVALVGLGCVLAAVVLATAVRMRGVDDVVDAPIVAIRLLHRTSVFSVLQLPQLEGVARASTFTSYAPGDLVITAGEVGDRYYAVASGRVDVFVEDRFVRSMGRGEGFGEIALIADVPRTATVVAATPTDLVSVDRSSFLTALTGNPALRRSAWDVAGAYERRFVRDAEAGT